MAATGRTTGMVRFYAAILRFPLLLTLLATIAIYYLSRTASIVHDTTFLGLLSQFDGTATTVFVALATVGPAAGPARYGKDARVRRRAVRIRFAAVVALASFVFATAGVHYRSLGAWALALNVTTVAAMLWGLAGAGDEA